MRFYEDHESLRRLSELKKYLFEKTIKVNVEEKIKCLENKKSDKQTLIAKIKNRYLKKEIDLLNEVKEDWLNNFLAYNNYFFIDYYEEDLLNSEMFVVNDMAKELRSFSLEKNEAIYLLKEIKSFEERGFFDLEDSLSFIRVGGFKEWKAFYKKHISDDFELFENYMDKINEYYCEEELLNPFFIAALLIYLERKYQDRIEDVNSDMGVLDQIILKEIC